MMIGCLALTVLMTTLVAGQETTPSRSSPPPPPPLQQEWHPVFYYESGADIPLPEGEGVFRRLVDHIERTPPRRIVISAHTDTVGSPEANLALSERRARALADRLIAAGVAPDMVELNARGEAMLARPTPDETAEPLNRRVVVDVYYR